MTLSYTLHFHLAVPDFLSEPWHGEFAQAMDSIDNALWNIIGTAGATIWTNSTTYTPGNLVVDIETGRVYIALLAHTSAPAPTTFLEDRTLNPENWSSAALEIATQAEAVGGLENTHYMTPLRTSQAIAAQVPGTTTASSPLPGGRLTLSSGNPVMITSISNAATLYYSPHLSRIIPIWTGGAFSSVDCWDELVAGLNDTTHNPSALTANKVFDWFIWVDSATVTIGGTPGTITLNNHGFRAGQPFRLITTGILPSPLVANLNYYVLTAGLTANSFQFSPTRAGIPINVSGGSGTHTLETRRLTHGPAWANLTTRGASAVLSRARGIWLNGLGITNGPALERGTYVGTTYNSAANQLAWQWGGVGIPGRFNVWNTYNRTNIGSTVLEPTASWSDETGAWEMMNFSANNRFESVTGLREDSVDLTMTMIVTSLSADAYMAIGQDWVAGTNPEDSGAQAGLYGVVTGNVTGFAHHNHVPALGFHYWQALESGSTGTVFWGYLPGSWSSGMTFNARM